MQKQQISLVQATFTHVAPIADTATTLFYQRLFELDPALRPLFPSDLEPQKAKLMQALTLVVRGVAIKKHKVDPHCAICRSSVSLH